MAQAQRKDYKVKSRCYKLARTIVLIAAILTARVASGNSVRFDFGAPGAPAITALFQDIGPGLVQLSIVAIALNGNNSLNSILFNLNPIFDAKALIFTQTGSVGVSGIVNSADNSYKIGGGSGKFDIDLLFDANFQTGTSVIYSITGIPNLSANDFLFLETPSAGRSSQYAAGSIRALSGFQIIEGAPQTVPDISSTCGLLLMGLLTLGSVARFFGGRVPRRCRLDGRS